LTARFRPEQFLFELLGLLQRQMARSPAVVHRLPYEHWSKMTHVRIPDGARSPRDWHAFELLHVFRLEIRVVKRQALWHGSANAKFGGQRHMHLGRARIRSSMSLVPGARLGPYEIVAPLGAGGMGEVFRARDTRLDRSVAIKVLPSALAADPQLRDRFEREARAISFWFSRVWCRVLGLWLLCCAGLWSCRCARHVP